MLSVEHFYSKWAWRTVYIDNITSLWNLHISAYFEIAHRFEIALKI